MSSTTDRGHGRHPDEGQVLVLFAGGLTLLLLIAALAFDVGMVLVERRDQQNAADAGALAGARYVFTSANFNGVCPDSGLTGNQAVDTACAITRINGFDHGADPSETVRVHIPPQQGRYAAFPGFIEVQIESSRPSIFSGVIGKTAWPVGAFGVATPGQNLSFSFGMIALDKTACKALQVEGSGVINSYGTIQSNSNGSECGGTDGPIGFSRTGGSTINVFAEDATCRAVGEIHDQGSGAMTCTQAEGSFALPDPLGWLPEPPKSPIPAAMQPVGHTRQPPSGCPGSPAPASESNPSLCRLGNGQLANLAWILKPGLYPGGLEVTGGSTVYLMPGIYWIGGGGLVAKNDGSIITIETEADATGTLDHATWDAGGGSVMIYNSQLSLADGDAADSPAGPITLNGGGATLWLKPFFIADTVPDSCEDYSCYNDIVIFQDRDVTLTVSLNGSDSIADVEGMIYVPSGEVLLNGNGGTLETDQIIANTFKINGNGGTININKNTDFESAIVAAGLVD